MVSLKAFSYLLDYRHKKVNDKLYKRAVRTQGAYMSPPKGLDSEGEIAHGSSITRDRPVGSVSPQEDIHGSGEKNNELPH